MVPSRARPLTTSRARSVCSLVYRGPRLPAPRSGRDHAGQSLSVVLPWLRGRVVRLCGGGRGKGSVHTPACVVPSSPPEGRRGAGCWGGDGGLPGPTRLPVPHPCLPSRASLSLASTTLVAPATRACAARVARCVLLGLCGCRLVPPSRGSVSTAGGIAGALLPPPRGREGPCLALIDLVLGGADRLVGERLLAASGASSDVGTRCRSGVFVVRHWCVGIGLSRVGVASSGSRGAVGFRVASVLQAWWDCSGEWCSVIPAGFASRARSGPSPVRPLGPL